MVDGVTKLGKMAFTSREAEQAENFRKMLLAMARRHPRHPGQARRPPRQHAHARVPAAREAGADRRRDDGDLRAARQPARHRQDQGRARGPLVPLPLARGVRGARAQDRGEAAGSRGLHPRRPRRGSRRPAATHGIEAEVTGRAKRLCSIWQKMQRQQIDLEEVYDVIAFRVLTDSVKRLLRGARRRPRHLDARSRAASRTTSRCPSRTCTSRCTPR